MEDSRKIERQATRNHSRSAFVRRLWRGENSRGRHCRSKLEGNDAGVGAFDGDKQWGFHIFKKKLNIEYVFVTITLVAKIVITFSNK